MMVDVDVVILYRRTSGPEQRTVDAHVPFLHATEVAG